MTAVADGVLLYATDPAPTAAELVFDFVQGNVLLAVALEADAGTVTGSLAVTEDTDVLAGAGSHGAAGTAAATDSGDTLAGSGAVGAAGSLAWTDEDDVLVAAAVFFAGISGDAAGTEADDVLVAVGTFTDTTTPPDVPPVRATDPVPMPRLTNRGRIVYLKLTADLGGVTAQTSPRIEFADEELIEIL